MKLKIYFLLLIAAFSLKTFAQQTNCNPNFTSTVSSLTVTFTPSFIGDSLFYSHYWSFGDGTTSNSPLVSHSYSNGGVYIVKHAITKHNTNGTIGCTDTVSQAITLSNTSPCNIQAYFTHVIDSINRKKVYFTNQTANFLPTDSIRWNFGDGTPFNYSINPTHTYAANGAYTVCIRVKRNTIAATPPCISEFCKVVIIDSVGPVNCNAAFTYNIQGLNVSFLSVMPATNTILHNWWFGNGTSSNLANPTNSYTTGGVYVVKHKVTVLGPNNAVACTDSSIQTITLQNPTPCNLQANFNVVRDNTNWRKYYFNNTTLNISATDSVRWTFGDNSNPSYSINANHTYAQTGTYQVCLRVKRNVPAGAVPCVSEICKTVVVTDSVAPCNLQAYFTFVKDNLNKKKVYFTNQTVNFLPTDSIRWNFGDGSLFNYTTNPTHTYTSNGTYNVCIRVKRNTNASTPPCVSEFCRVVVIDSVTIGPTPCNYNVDFSMIRDSFNVRKVYFTNLSQNASGAIATWYFGDGTSATGWNATHTYANNGINAYHPCLKVTYSNTCSKIKCKVLQLSNATTVCNLQPYPNPASSVVNATVNLTQPAIIFTRVINSSNVIVRQQQQNGIVGVNTVSVNVATLPIGMYRLEIRYGSKQCKGTFLKN